MKMATDFDFNDKVVLVTGSSGGIGSAIAREFAKRGANLVITGRREDAIENVANECSSLSPNGAEHLTYVGDVTNTESLKGLMDATIGKFGKLDVLVNNAGGGIVGSIMTDNIQDIFKQMMELNVYSAVTLTQLAIPHLEKTKGSIINISSILAQKPMAPFVTYCAAKAALEMFSKCIAIELGPKGIRVNLVSPTGVRTGFQQATGAGDILDGVLNELEGKIPLRRIATEEDVSNAVLFLASDKASYLTAVNIAVDGGNLLI